MATLPQILNFFIRGSLIVLKHASTSGKLLAAVLADRNLICSGSLNPNGGQALHPVMKKKNFEKMDKAVLYSFGYFGRV